jgi:hypothetical protein
MRSTSIPNRAMHTVVPANRTARPEVSSAGRGAGRGHPGLEAVAVPGDDEEHDRRGYHPDGRADADRRPQRILTALREPGSGAPERLVDAECQGAEEGLAAKVDVKLRLCLR